MNPVAGQISRNGETVRLEMRTMRVLVCLAEHAGDVVSIDDLLSAAWAGVNVSPDSVYQAVASLRRLLGDDPKEPTYIATVPRLGYRMVAEVEPWNESAGAEAIVRQRGGSRLRGLQWAVLAAGVCVVVVAVLTVHSRTARLKQSQAAADAAQQNSIAVLPFLDLTEEMTEEPFADGMTEELIDKLSKVPGLRVPPPTSSFYFKGKQVSVADIAKALGVTYVLDGSVRKSGKMVRVAARLVRADNDYIMWTETYDRPFDDLLMVQDDIAGEVTKALRSSIGSGQSGAGR
ncbi:MAG TPA: winged helix-turn-helix domain-containing protein [Candidatus Sulfotelmatobacter sp.]|nr:winged helix-turn-helix domain-containing protein [Candidatus Sulfotelmatobacter sp.]